MPQTTLYAAAGASGNQIVMSFEQRGGARKRRANDGDVIDRQRHECAGEGRYGRIDRLKLLHS